MSNTLEVRSHVSRDLLQAAAMFKNERLVVWEYVSNGLDYVDPGTNPVVRVRLDARNKRITVEDNGRGMDWPALKNFFVMHGENLDRKAGRAARGRFGTGKSAAFGIGDTLRITSTRDGKRSRVELSREDLEGMDSGDPVRVRVLEREVRSDAPNGTTIEIEEVHLRAFDQSGVVAYIERHLAHWPKSVRVFVNNHECEFSEPPVAEVRSFKPSAEQAAVLGDIELIVKVSKSPLGQDLCGIAFYADGIWHETSLLSSAGKEMSEFIFGEVDVKRLEEDRSTPAAFDASRSMRLNPDNRLVATLFSFVAPRIEKVRKALVEAQREARSTERAKRLRQEAAKIEEIINQDFEAFRKRLQKVKAAEAEAGFDASESGKARTGDLAEDEEPDDDFLFGGDEPATIVDSGDPGTTQDGDGGEGGEPRRLNPIVRPDSEGRSTGHWAKGKNKPRSRGGFQIAFEQQGEASARAVYQREKRTIYINLDHPQIDAALRGHGVEDPVFRRLAYEVAFSEYAVALAMELYYREEFVDPQDAIVEIRETIHRIARAAAAIYA